MKRIEQKVEDTWCLEDMFESDDFWEEEFGRLQRMIFQYEDFEGTLGESADRLLEYLKFNDETNLLMERLYVYANMRYHQDMANSMYQEFAARAQKLMVEMSGASAFAEPEILEITTEKINVFFNENPELETYKRYISERQTATHSGRGVTTESLSCGRAYRFHGELTAKVRRIASVISGF